MRHVLGTRALPWWVEGRALSDEANELLGDFGQHVLVSVVARGEIAFKESKGRLEPPADLPQSMADSGFDVLPVRWSHAQRVGELPLHHRDLVDRMLVAQALEKECVPITRDRQFQDYGAPTVTA